MVNEVAVPQLPCRSIDEITTFYGALGFRTTYRQTRPNPYAALRREDLEMHFFAIEGFDPPTATARARSTSLTPVLCTAPSRTACARSTARCPSGGFPG